MLVDDNVVTDIQAKAGTFPYRLGGEEGIEHLPLDLCGDSRPVVFDLDNGPIAFAPGADG